MFRRIFLWCQVAFSAIIFIWSVCMCIGCLFCGVHGFYCFVLALFSILAYKLLGVTRSELKGGNS